MGEAGHQPAMKFHVMGIEHETPSSAAANVTTSINPKSHRGPTWWLRVALYSFMVLAGQSAATLLGRLYYAKGGNSKWMATLVEAAGFPILLPLYLLIINNKKKKKDSNKSLTLTQNSSFSVSLPFLALGYFTMGILIAGFGLLYAIGLKYLPVSTYSLICATQLGFNALFAFFINSQKFTLYIINSLVLLTLSSVLLVFQSDNNEGESQSHNNFTKGFICTVVASAGYGLMLSLTQYFLEKVVRKATFKEVLDVLVYPSAVASAAAVVGLIGSGEWKGIREEMEGFGMGKVSYVMTLVWTGVCWQVYSIGCVGLILEVSSLFSNVIGTFGLPIVPIMAVFFFRDKMDGLKVVAMVLAVWGFVSYAYQHYLDNGLRVVVDDDRNEDG
ncbi:Purine permease 21 [Linum perenne]